MARRRQGLHGLYVITDGVHRELHELEGRAAAVLQGGARILQYRDKSSDQNRRRREARLLRRVCDAAGALFIVNDDVTLALEADADGVHLGRDDDALVTARHRLGPDRLIGVSCYDSLERAAAMAAAGADYLAFGAVFPSPTKPDAVRVSMDTLIDARQRFSLPLVAIGGISVEHVPGLAGVGLDALAVISAVFSADDPRAAAERFCAAMPPSPQDG